MNKPAEPLPMRWPDWLARHGLAHLVPLLQAEAVRDDVIDQLDDADLAALGVRLGDRKRFLKALAHWSDPASPTDDISPQRRQLTILFCDLVDSTTLCQALPPEIWRDTVLHYQRVAGEVLAAHGGTVAQYLGDGLLVYFGFPVAMEDAALQAVQAALGVVSALAERPCLASGRPLSLRVRVGVDTGLVVVGDMGDGPHRRERLALGDAPNVAARLQSLAAPGEVLVSGATWQLVSAHVEGQHRGQHALKGRSEPTEVWQVQRSRGLMHRFEARQQAQWSPLVGRQHELQTLVRAWRQVVDGQGRVVWIEGDPGMGKSRLVGALREQVGVADGQIWVWQSSAQLQQRSFQVAANALVRIAGLQPAQPTEQRAAQWRHWLGERGGVDPLHEALLSSLLGLPLADDAPALPPDADERWSVMGMALQAVLQRLAVRAPLLWLIEDVHWADPAMLKWLTEVAISLRDWPVLLVLTARPEAPWRAPTGPHIDTLVLPRLSADEAIGLVDHTLRHHALDASWREFIARRTDGVPLFVEELARALTESSTEVSAAAVPHTLQDLLMARLDRAGPEARLVAQAASVLGREFDRNLLYALVAQACATASASSDALEWPSLTDVSDVDAALSELVTTGLLAPHAVEPTGRDAASRWSFKHALMQDVAYDSMVQARRVALHAALLDVLLRQPEMEQVDPALLARHADAAQQRARAVPWWLRASEQALQRLTLSDAASHLQTGLMSAEALPTSPLRNRHLLQLHAMLGTVHMLAKGWAAPEVAQAYERAHALAQGADGVEEALWPLWGICVFHQVRGELNEAVATGRRMLTVARQSHSRVAWLVTNMMHTQLCLYSGQPAEVPAHVEQVQHRYSDPVDRALMALYSTDLLLVAQVHGLHARWLLGEDLDLEAACVQQEARAAELNHPYSMAWTLSWGAMVLLHEGRPEALWPRLQRAQSLADTHGYAYVQAMTRFAAGWCRHQQRQEASSRVGVQEMREGLEAFKTTGAGIVVPFFQTVLAEALADLGELHDAMALVNHALQRVQSGGERWHEAEAHRVQARLWWMGGAHQHERARQALRTALDVARAQQARRWQRRAESDWQRCFSEPPWP